MGNRGKGLSKGKKGKKGKKGGGGASKWGDENSGRDEQDQPVKKKRRITQEAQDRQRRVKIMELNRTKEREHRQRLSQPNQEPVEAPVTKPKKRRRKKRPLGTKLPADSRKLLYYSSSDDDSTLKQNHGGFDSGLASYKKLLSALQNGGSDGGLGRRIFGSGGAEDADLTAAVMARRMQREGRDESYDDSANSSGDSGSEEREDGEDNANGLLHPHAPYNGTSAHEQDGEGGKIADGRSRDEFCRHFVSTPVFPAKKAAEILSARGAGRPSFKPLPASAARNKWGSVGLSALASRSTSKEEREDFVPPALAKGASLTADLGVLPSLAEGWDACNDGASASKLQSLLLPPLTGYRDMLYCGWRDEDAGDIRRSYALHALNHALTSQRRVLRHTVRLRKAADEARVADTLARAEKKKAGAGDGVAGGKEEMEKPAAPDSTTASAQSAACSNGASPAGGDVPSRGAGGTKENSKVTIDPDSDDWQRDQGFTRPKVLILLPFRGLAHELVEIMIGLLGPKTVTINKDRFDQDARAARAKAVLERKPRDWKALLGEGRNVDDMFTIGLSLSPGGGKGKPGEGKGVGVRLYCDFYNSDIIIASPVALHRASVPGEDGGDADRSGVDSDFLSSVEVCIMDRADVFLMQNWAYVPDIAEVLNSRPSGERAARADFSRVRPLFLHEQGKLFRQTLVFSAFQDPNLNALASRYFRNHDGAVKVWRPSGDGHICEVALQAKQVFQRVPCDSLASQDDSRFDYFVGTVLPQVLRAKQTHTAVFIPSYFDYVRVRNHLMKNKASVVNVHEYSRGSEVARSRARFFRGDRDILLYTGRAHFFNRYCIRGIHHLIFYSLPECPQFYPEMVNLLEEAESVAAVTCLSLFTRFERLGLERIVGEERAGHMLASSKNTFLFC
ncbi:unnamed protein product [Scytosiphon promiscuus]